MSIEAMKQKPFGWVNMLELTNRFEWVDCGTIYKNAGEGRTPVYTAPPTCQENRQVAKSATTDWEAVAADQAMTIAMMKLEQKREWIEIPYVSQHDSPVEYNIAEAVAWAVGYNQAIDNIKERNT
jgi:hypothetical protein